MKKLNNYLAVGALFSGFWLLTKNLNFVPDFFQGFSMGLGMTLSIYGLIIECRKKKNTL